MHSLTAQILRSHATGDALAGSAYLPIEPDLVLGHEATIALLIARLKASGRPVFDPTRCFFAADHFVPPATAERAAILRGYLDFVAAQGISQDQLFRGISHQLLIEDGRCKPGALICGADSHTTTGGAMGAFSAGFGSTDILALLVFGRVHVKIPEAMRLVFLGRLPEAVTGKDLALEMLRRLGEGGARYRALEFVDETDSGLSLAARCTVANLAVECGAKNGLFVPDDITAQALMTRDGALPDDFERWTAPPGDRAYVAHLRIDVGDLCPLVARPGSPADVIAASDAEPETVHQVFVGSCAGGRLEDLAQAADVLDGRGVKPGVRMVVTPASQKVYAEAIEAGIVSRLVAAGAMVTASACGACGGIDKGLLAPGEVCISTSNRNFRGRMGSNDARIWLASAKTAAAAAVTGHITDPRSLT